MIPRHHRKSRWLMKSSSRGGRMQLGSSIVGDRSCDFCGVSFLLCVYTFLRCWHHLGATWLKTTGMAVQHLPWLISAARIQASMCAATPLMTGQNHTKHAKHQDGSPQITNNHACQGLAWDWCALGRYVNWIHATKLRKRIKIKHAMMSNESNSNSNKSVWKIPKNSRFLSKKYIMPWNILKYWKC